MFAVELVAAVMMGGDESSSMLVVDAIAAAALQCEFDVLMECCDEESGGEGKQSDGKAVGLHPGAEREREIGHPARPMARGGIGRVSAGYTRGEYCQLVQKGVSYVLGFQTIWANQPIQSFLVGCLNPCLQGISVRVVSSQPSQTKSINKNNKFLGSPIWKSIDFFCKF